MSEILLMQAIEDVRHLSQKHIIKIYNYIILNSFNIKLFKNNLFKMIFNLLAEFNDELFNIIFLKILIVFLIIFLMFSMSNDEFIIVYLDSYKSEIQMTFNNI